MHVCLRVHRKCDSPNIAHRDHMAAQDRCHYNELRAPDVQWCTVIPKYPDLLRLVDIAANKVYHFVGEQNYET